MPSCGIFYPEVDVAILIVVPTQKNGKADPDFSNPPNCLGFDDIQNKAGTALGGTSHRARSEQNIHVHLDGISDLLGRKSSPSRKRPYTPDVIELDDSDVGASESPFENTKIADVLAILNEKWPDHNYPQYLEKLREHGLVYGAALLDFGHDWYEDVIKMKAGAIGTFLREVSGLTGKRNARKRPRIEMGSPLTPSKCRNM